MTTRRHEALAQGRSNKRGSEPFGFLADSSFLFRESDEEDSSVRGSLTKSSYLILGRLPSPFSGSRKPKRLAR
jgi:hypothetical protein